MAPTRSSGISRGRGQKVNLQKSNGANKRSSSIGSTGLPNIKDDAMLALKQALPEIAAVETFQKQKVPDHEVLFQAADKIRFLDDEVNRLKEENQRLEERPFAESMEYAESLLEANSTIEWYQNLLLKVSNGNSEKLKECVEPHPSADSDYIHLKHDTLCRYICPKCKTKLLSKLSSS